MLGQNNLKYKNGGLQVMIALRRQRITADKREIKDFPKSRQVGTSFIRNR